MHWLQTVLSFSKILKTNNGSIKYASAALNIYALRKVTHATNRFALETISGQCLMFSLRQAKTEKNKI